MKTSPGSLLLLLAIGVQSWAAPPNANQRDLSAALDAEGRVQMGVGQGSFDASGYELVSKPGEPPQFAPVQSAGQKYFGVGYGCNAEASDMAQGADRRIYLVGEFTYCGDAVTRHVAVYDPRSGRFSALGDGVNGPAARISISGNDVYISGSFSQAGDAPALRLAHWDGQRWSGMGNLSYTGATLAAVPGGVYVAAGFIEIDGLVVNNIAYWEKAGGQWQALGDGDAVGTDGAIRAMAVGSDGLYVGGRFNQAGGTSVNSIARWDGRRWFDVGGGLIPPGVFDEPVAAMAAQGRDVYVTGFYTLANHSAVRNIARWDGQAWHAVGDPAQIASRGFRLALSGREIVATGLLDGQIAHFDGSAWSVFSDYYGLSPNAPGAMLMADSSLYLGGNFYAADGIYAENIVRWNGTSFSALTHGAPRVANGAISVVSVTGDSVYIGGRFTEVDGVPAIGIARWNGSRWSAVGAGLDFGDTFSLINAIAEYAGELYVAGQFSLVDGLTVNNIVRWDGVRWQTVGSGVESGTGAQIKALVEYAGELYVAGAFTRAGSVTARGIARWNGQRWEALGSGVNMPDNGSVSALVPMASGLMVSGSFTLAGGQWARYVARWDGSAWSGIEPINELGLFSAPLLAATGTDLVLAGARVNVTGYAYQVTRWNGVNLTPVGALPILDINLGIRALAASGPDIYLRGDSAGGRLGRFSDCCTTAHWDGSSWAPFYDPSPRAAQATERIPLAMDGDVLSVNAYDLRASALPTRISQPATGGDANGASGQVALSADGLRVVYRSDASNLAGGAAGVFLRDRVSGIQTRLSSAVEALDPSLQESHGRPAISGNGQVTALTGSAGQVYRISHGQAEIASRAIDGSGGNGASGNPRLNADGSRMVFDSRASNLVADDGNGSLSDVFLRHFTDASTTLISRTADGSPGNGPSTAAVASDDGSRVAFVTSASNLSGVSGGTSQVVLSQIGSNGRELRLISRNPLTGEPGNGSSRDVRLTPDGRYGVFVSAATNLVAGDSNGVDDVFLFGFDEGGAMSLRRMSLGPQGNQANAASTAPSISHDGSYIAFASDASNLVLVDRNQQRDVFVKNVATGEVLRMSASVDGQAPAAPSAAPSIAGDAASLVFVSDAANLVAADNNAVADVYWTSLRRPDTQAPGPGVDEPGAAHFTLPAPSSAFPNCPAGFFIATVDDGPGVGLTPGLFGMELLLDPGGSQRLEGGLNFGGLIDKSQEGFAGFNIQNAANESQKLTIRLSGYAFGGSGGSLPVKVQVLRQPAAGVNELVYERSTSISSSAPLLDEVVIEPGFHVVTVLPDETAAGEPGGAAEGQIFFELGTRYVDRIGGGFFGGVVVGGYHAPHPDNDVSGFAAFCLATPHNATVRTLSTPSYGISAARDLRLKLLDYQRNEILVR